VELRDLRYFVVVAEELHFGRAAERLHIVTAAVSQRIRDLEHELGVTLFERTSRRVTLSDEGAGLLPLARRALLAVDDVTQQATALRDGSQGRVRIGFAPASIDVIDALVREVARRDTAIELVAESLWSLRALEALEALERGELGLALVREPLPEWMVESTVIGTYRDDHVAVRSDGPFVDRAEVSLSEFEGERVLVNDRDLAPRVHDETCGSSPSTG